MYTASLYSGLTKVLSRLFSFEESFSRRTIKWSFGLLWKDTVVPRNLCGSSSRVFIPTFAPVSGSVRKNWTDFGVPLQMDSDLHLAGLKVNPMVVAFNCTSFCRF